METKKRRHLKDKKHVMKKTKQKMQLNLEKDFLIEKNRFYLKTIKNIINNIISLQA